MAKHPKESRHVRLYHWILRSGAWTSLNPVERALYVELSSRYAGPDSDTNGRIVFSVRQAADALHVSKATAARAFDGLQRRGFISVQKLGGFNLKDRKGQATEWRLTEFHCGSTPPT